MTIKWDREGRKRARLASGYPDDGLWNGECDVCGGLLAGFTTRGQRKAERWHEAREYHRSTITTALADLGDDGKVRAMKRKIAPPAPWIAPGVKVRYHPIIGRDHDGRVYTVRENGGPKLMGGHTWVVWLDEKGGCVACEAVSEVAP